jgi:hypothetical protein
LANGGVKRGEYGSDDSTAGVGEQISMSALDFGDKTVSAEKSELTGHPGGAATGLFWRGCGRGEEERLKVAIANAGEYELTASNSGKERFVLIEGAESSNPLAAPDGVFSTAGDEFLEGSVVVDGGEGIEITLGRFA